MSSIKLPAELENLETLVLFISAFAKEKGFLKEDVLKIELAAEEALVNIFNYAYPNDNSGEVEIRCNLDQHDALIVEIVDSGVPFDIRSVPEPDISKSISGQKLGGLGIFLIRKLVDAVRYRRDRERNVLTLVLQRGVARRPSAPAIDSEIGQVP